MNSGNSNIDLRKHGCIQASLVNKSNVFSICKSNLFFHKQGFSNNILADDAATYPIQQLLFQETKCVVFTFDTKSKECILYEDVTGGDVKADEDYIIGFCPKPKTKYGRSIDTNDELKWWCHQGTNNLCYYPYTSGVFKPKDCSNSKCCSTSPNNYALASPCPSQSMVLE